MVTGTLYTLPDNFRSHKVLVAGQYGKASINVISEPSKFILGETNKSADFLKKFPLGKVPAFQTKDNDYIFESNAIAFYVGNEQLRGATILDQAHVLQWLSFSDHELLPSMAAWVFPSLSIMHYCKNNVDRAKEDLSRALQAVNDHLLSRTYLVGERISLADISLCTVLLPLYQHVMESSYRNAFPNVNRWFITLVNQAEFKAVLGEIKLCDTAKQFDAKKFAELSISSKGKACEDKSKDKKVDEKKKEKKAAAPKKKEIEEAEEMDETEMILAKEDKPKDPFEKFPAGKFNMDAFKRCYSNEPESVSIPYFWTNLDKEHYSIWFCEYKYPEDLTMVFMSCNLISGMFQRLDKMRKNAFGSMVLFGEDNASTISGIWVWRGSELAFELSDDWKIDYESYKWEKLDNNSDKTKKMVEEYFSWSGDFGGKKFNQGKIFK